MNIQSKTFLVLIIGTASFTVFAPMASATTMQVTMNYGSRHSGDGGEFNASSPDFVPATMGYTADTIYHGGFETFCVETNEFFYPGSTYYYSISQVAINGGVAGGNPDPISRGTAWLYLNFANGTLATLAGYDYTIGSSGNASAAALQATIWWLEGELPTAPNNAFTTLVEGLPNYLADNNGYYGVGVLNLWGDINHTLLAQDQLVLLPADVPDVGSTAMLLGLALLGLFVARGKLNRHSHAP